MNKMLIALLGVAIVAAGVKTFDFASSQQAPLAHCGACGGDHGDRDRDRDQKN